MLVTVMFRACSGFEGQRPQPDVVVLDEESDRKPAGSLVRKTLRSGRKEHVNETVSDVEVLGSDPEFDVHIDSTSGSDSDIGADMPQNPLKSARTAPVPACANVSRSCLDPKGGPSWRFNPSTVWVADIAIVRREDQSARALAV